MDERDGIKGDPSAREGEVLRGFTSLIHEQGHGETHPDEDDDEPEVVDSIGNATASDGGPGSY
jgi:hypothetical protein